ncbi:amidase family protein [Pseudomonas sp. F8002]|uniref:amidase family protein n=1 Tax=Pseudomonas sp. F8002 TaxID=2738822 RepID=UPI003525D4B2
MRVAPESSSISLLRLGQGYRTVFPTFRQAGSIYDRTGFGRGPLHGVPIALKDVFETGDKMQTSGGSMARVGRPASRNAKVVDNLLKAGVVIIGKTNRSELSNFHSYSYYYSAVAGYPGISMPSGMDDEGMPTAVHFYGANLSEATLLSVAYGYEQASHAIRKPAFTPGLR